MKRLAKRIERRANAIARPATQSGWATVPLCFEWHQALETIVSLFAIADIG